ncbi:ATP-binding protein [Candidatus Woesearchaeota archaeon]|nr:ATP-binding protein [Candidatus Woesearchaeota archaeon]
MILGKIIGKLSTTEFTFSVTGDAKKHQYVQVMHPGNYFVLAQIAEITKDVSNTLAYCHIIGYKEDKHIVGIKTPFNPETEVLKAEDSFLQDVLGITKDSGAFIGKLDGRDNISIYLDFNKMLTKHVAVLAKTGAGKSYVSGVLVEEILNKNIPILIIDPHGEYSSLKYPNPEDIEKLSALNLSPKGFLNHICEYSPDLETNTGAMPLKLNASGLTSTEIMKLLPIKLSLPQQNLLYSALKNMGTNKTNFDELLLALEYEDNSAKWTLMNVIEYMKKLNLFSEAYTSYIELIQPGKASIINLRGVDPEVQEVIVHKLVSDLFNERKRSNIPPFFLLIEEAHNFCPERNFGEAKSSGILRTIAAEGRKFGLGLCVITQRPSRIEKSVLSQCNTQIILKVSNPGDIKAIATSAEGMNAMTENEIPNIPIGNAMITGVIDIPIFVNVRPRITKHGGEAVKIFDDEVEIQEPMKQNDFVNEIRESKELLPLINQRYTKRDIELMVDNPENLEILLIPCALVNCYNNEEFNILIDLASGKIIRNIETLDSVEFIHSFPNISSQESKVLGIAITLGKFKASELFSKSGLQFGEIYDIINVFETKNLLIKEGDSFQISNSLKIFSKLKDCASYEKVEYGDIKFDRKIEKKYDSNQVKTILEKFIKVNSSKEGFLVFYNLKT